MFLLAKENRMIEMDTAIPISGTLIVSVVILTLFVAHMLLRLFVTAGLKYDETVYTERLSKPIQKEFIFSKMNGSSSPSAITAVAGVASGVNKKEEANHVITNNLHKKKVVKIPEIDIKKVTASTKHKSEGGASDKDGNYKSSRKNAHASTAVGSNRKKVRSKSPTPRRHAVLTDIKAYQDEGKFDNESKYDEEDDENGNEDGYYDEGDEIDETEMIQQRKNTRIIVTGGCG